MACLLAAFASLSFLRSSASMLRLVTGSTDSSVLHSGQRLAKPGLSGFNSNSSEQMAQTLIGKGIISMIKPTSWDVYRFARPPNGRQKIFHRDQRERQPKGYTSHEVTALRAAGHLFDLSEDMEIGPWRRRLFQKRLTKLYVSINLR
jgi:hypothetical protein